MSEELKPCPFCGCNPTVSTDNLGYYHIECGKCPCQLDNTYYDENEMMESWNRRS